MKKLRIKNTCHVSGGGAWHEKTPQYTALIITDSSSMKNGKLTMFSDSVVLQSHAIYSGHTGFFTYNGQTTYVYPYLDLQGKCTGSIYITK